jgi:acetyl-CoA C-acetyltransferase
MTASRALPKLSDLSDTDVVIVSAVRTPLGSFQGQFAAVPATKLGSIAINAALERAGVAASSVSEVIMGNVLTAGEGQAPARQAAIGAGIPHAAPALTINKVCGSGMKALMLGSQSIRLGDSDVVVAGGMENMTQAPYILPTARAGMRMGHQQALDTMVFDGLWDPYNNQHMGNCAELCAREKTFTREQQDAFAVQSFQRSLEAQKGGKFKNEIAPVTVAGKKGDTVIDSDEGPAKVQFDKIPTLKPVFDKAGSVTAANASTINDGAAALVLMSVKKARELGAKPLARLVSYGSNAQAPEWFTTAPAEAMRRAMKKAGWTAGDVDLFEVNEAFAVVALAAQRELEIPNDKFNVNGGAISLGHPIGASGARIVVTLVHALAERGLARGVAGICIGGGEGTAVCVERLQA